MDRNGEPRIPEQRAPVLAADDDQAADTADLRFGVLGSVRAWRGADVLPSGSPQQRALLAALLLRDGRTATAAELIDAIWGDEPPRRPWRR